MPALPLVPTNAALDFLVALLNIPSPTGYTHEAVQFCHDAFAALPLPPNTTLTITTKGALLIEILGVADDAPVGLTAHLDTLGLMVKEVKSNGRLKCSALGGIVWAGIEAEGVTVRTATNQRVRGSVMPLNASVHVNDKLRTQERNENTLEIRLDARTESAAETRALGIEVGDFVFIDPRVERTNGFIRARFLDDKLSVACLYAALLMLNGEAPAQSAQILISNYEEVGHGGNDGWRPDLFELIAVEMAAVGDGQNSDEYHCTLCVKDSGGPYHFETTERLRTLGQRYSIPLKTDIYPYYSSDGSAYWRGGGRARVGLVGPGVGGSHHYERSHTDALDDTARLLWAYLTNPMG